MNKFLRWLCKMGVHAVVEVNGDGTMLCVHRCLICGRASYLKDFGHALIEIPRDVCRYSKRHVQRLD